MWNNEYYWFICLFPLAFQIVLPLLILCCWSVAKLPSLIFSNDESTIKAEPVQA